MLDPVITSEGLAVRGRDGRWRAFRKGDGGGDGLASAAVNHVHAGADGRVWVLTDAGLAAFEPERATFRTVGLGITVPVWHAAESPADPGALWLATVGAGACRYEPASGAARCLGRADGLPSNVVHRIEPGDGALWVGTDAGLARLDPATGAVATFTAADGLHGDVVDLMSSHRGAGGALYFGGPGGYTAFDPAAVRARETAPPVRFVSVAAGAGAPDRAVASGDRVVLGRPARRLAVAFAALDYARPRATRYRYRLAPLEADWAETDGDGAFARYGSVPPGEYAFEVVAQAGSGAFGSAPARLAVVVPPAWWERPVAWAVGVLALVGLVGAGVWRRGERRRAEAVELARRLAASREGERVRLARELHDGPVQQLYQVGHGLDRLGAETGARVGAMRSALDAASGELRAVLTDIRPPHVGTLGAGAAVDVVVRRFADAYPGVDVELDLAAAGRAWPVAVQHAAVRIVQEALSNAGRHAGARSVRVSLGETGGAAVVEVADDGRGFDASVRDVDRVREAHFGLAGLRERADALGGRAEVASAPGRGTVVRARLPLAGP